TGTCFSPLFGGAIAMAKAEEDLVKGSVHASRQARADGPHIPVPFADVWRRCCRSQWRYHSATRRQICRAGMIAQNSTSLEYDPLVQEGLSKRLFLPESQIAQFDCSVRAGEEADEAGADRDDPWRIYFGQNPDVDEPGLQDGTAKGTGKPKHDSKHKHERRLQGFFHCRFRSSITCRVAPRARPRLRAELEARQHSRMTLHCDQIREFWRT